MSDSIKTLSYKFAANRDMGRIFAREILNLYPDFADTVPEEAKPELQAGCYLRFAENNANREGFYILTGDAYVQTDEAKFAKSKSIKAHLTVGFATSHSPQAFGQLRQSDPALFNLIKPLRDDANKYASNTIKSLQRTCREIVTEGATRSRAPTAHFSETVEKVLDQMRTRCKSAKSRGDETADEGKLSKAIIAFNTVWKH